MIFLPLLIATMTLESFIPATCYMAPEIPTAKYNSGATTFPVYPTYISLETNPASKKYFNFLIYKNIFLNTL